MSKVAIEALTKRFGEVVALNGIDLTIGEGEFLGLLGPSGCGKSTTLNLVAGFDEPTSGRILVDGQDVAPVPANRRGMGVVFQSYALFPHMTAAENVAFGLDMRRVEKAERVERTRRALDLVRLEALADRYPRHLSGGQQQRVALARALAIEPKLLLLDEPLSNLDAKLREEMQVELRAIQRRTGITAVIVTHDQAEALAICDRIAVMEAGRISQIGDPLTLYEAPATAFVAGFVGRSSRLAGRVAEPRGDGLLSVELDGSARRVEGRSVNPLKPGAKALVALRPERMRLTAPGAAALEGTVRSRVFQGSAWLFLIDTSAGLIEALEPNRGAPRFGEGDKVGIAWDGADAVVVPVDGRDG